MCYQYEFLQAFEENFSYYPKGSGYSDFEKAPSAKE
jgi:hypothetical protein